MSRERELLQWSYDILECIGWQIMPVPRETFKSRLSEISAILSQPESEPSQHEAASPHSDTIRKYLEACSDVNKNHYLYDDGFCKSRQMAQDASLCLSCLDELERQRDELSAENEELRSKLNKGE